MSSSKRQDKTLVYCTDSDIRIRDWEEDAVLFHPGSATTLRISRTLAAAITRLRGEAMDIGTLARVLSPTHGQREDIADHLREGLEKLQREGIIRRHE